MGDGSLWTDDAGWTAVLKDLIQSYLGPDRRAGSHGIYAEPSRRYEEDLADSAFSDVSQHLFRFPRAWTPQQVIGYLRTTSFASADLFAERHAAFEEAALAEYLIRAGQAACAYSCRVPPSLARRRMSRRAIRSGSSIGSGNGRRGRAFARPWCGLCSL